MTNPLRRPIRIFITTALLIVLVGCQVMDSSVSYEIRPDGSQVRRCSSALGSYALPYSVIKVTVYQQYKAGVKTGKPRLQVSKPEAHPDRDPKHIYCLDFLESAVSDDNVTVAFDKQGDIDTFPNKDPAATGLLSLIASKNIDQTGEIIRNILRAIFIFASGDSNFSFGREAGADEPPLMMTEQVVDPFDLSAMAGLNKSLNEYGFCLTLGKYTFDDNKYSPDAYCDKPDLSVAASAMPPLLRAAKDQRYLVDKMPVGIFYRPRQPYKIFVYVRDDPDAHRPWELRSIDTVMLENLSPILALEVNRTIFAEYRTAFAFDHGNLIDACVAKGSEVLGGLQIPLDIIYGVVSLPAATIGHEIQIKTTTATLLSKQRDIIALQDQILLAKAGNFPGTDTPATAAPLGTDLQFATPAAHVSTPGQIGEEKFGDFCKLLKSAGAS
jgi:hypothetical protein